MRRQLDERRPEAIAECKQACDEVIRRALAVVEAAKMRDDLREFGTKPEPLTTPLKNSIGIDLLILKNQIYPEQKCICNY